MSDASDTQRTLFLSLFGIIAAIQIAYFIVDPNPHFYWSDSSEYLYTAFEGGVPPDRPFFYGYLIRFVAATSGDLTSLIYFQVFLFILATLAFAFTLTHFLGLSPFAVLILTVFAATAPFHVVWTRFVMAEVPSLSLLTGMILTAFCYLRSGKFLWLPALAAIGILGVGFRSAFILPALFLPLTLPLAYWVKFNWILKGDFASFSGAPPGAHYKKLAVHTIAAAGMVAVLHTGYQNYYTSEFVEWQTTGSGLNRYGTDLGRGGGGPEYNAWYRNAQNRYQFEPSYSFADGLFLIAYLAPVIEPRDFPKEVDGDKIVFSTELDLKDRQIREWQRWSSQDGLAAQVVKAVEDDPSIRATPNQVARTAAFNAMQRDPWGAARLTWQTLLDYWDSRLLRQKMIREMAIGWEPNALSPVFVERMKEVFAYDISRHYNKWTPLKNLFMSWQVYAAMMSFASFVVPIALLTCRRKFLAELILLSGVLMYWNIAAGLLATGPNARYMLPVSWLFLMSLAPVLTFAEAKLRVIGAISGSVFSRDMFKKMPDGFGFNLAFNRKRPSTAKSRGRDQ